ncbi:hypothetical protein ACFVYR_07105 [Streptomyces sp. NPDC058284]|uniref:hypothetical protein n=1 Tax=unclassified Streptomyces TaxID=2593676 RepID=UPI003667B80F
MTDRRGVVARRTEDLMPGASYVRGWNHARRDVNALADQLALLGLDSDFAGLTADGSMVGDGLANVLGKGPVAEHLVRVYGRAEVRDLMISASGFTQPAVDECRRVLAHRVVVLGELRELVMALEQERPLDEWLREKARRAMVDREPLAIYGVHF